MSKYHNDQPIHGGTGAPDLLNRHGFANNLANLLLLKHDDDCLTVSLEGEWGYGKTSVINLVKKAFNDKSVTPIVVEYNPWLAGSSESLIQDFLLQFSSQLNIGDNSELALKASKEIIAYSSLFSVAKLVPGAEPWASIIENVFKKFGSSSKKIANLKKLDLLGKKKKVVAAIKKINTPIVVIIDDIDRLTPSETFQVLRLVKAVADFSGTSFLLAFDPSYLVSVLDKNGIVNSSEYIDKVIQLRAPLPIVSDRGMGKIADVELNSLSDKNLTERFDGDQDRLSWIYHSYAKNLIKNPRELKRLFNHLRFILEQIEGQVCFSDLYSLSIIATKINLVYEYIKKTPEAYIGQNFLNDHLMIKSPEEVVKDYEDERAEYLEGLSKRDRKLISDLLGDIFPLLGSGRYPHYESSHADSNGRVSAPQRLHIALHYKTPSGYQSDDKVLDFIAGTISRAEFLSCVITENSSGRFFEMMMIYSEKCQENSFDILTEIYDAFIHSEELISVLESDLTFMKRNPYREIIWLTNKVISESEDKSNLIKKLIGREESAPISGEIVKNVREQLSEDVGGKPWVSLSSLPEFEADFQLVAKSALTKKLFIHSHLESRIFYDLKRSSVKVASEYMANILKGDGGVLRVCEILKNSGSDSNNGPYVQIDEETCSQVIDLENLREKAKGINIQSQPVHIQASIKSILDGNKYYLRDGARVERL